MGWLCRAPKDLLSAGHGEAYCKLCRVSLRAQKHDLKKHLTTKAHKEKALALNLTKQKCLMDSDVVKQIQKMPILLYYKNHICEIYEEDRIEIESLRNRKKTFSELAADLAKQGMSSVSARTVRRRLNKAGLMALADQRDDATRDTRYATNRKSDFSIYSHRRDSVFSLDASSTIPLTKRNASIHITLITICSDTKKLLMMNSKQRKQFLLLLYLLQKKSIEIDTNTKLPLAVWYARLKRTAILNHQRKRRWWIRPINQKRNEQSDGNHLIEEMRLYDTEVHFQYTRLNIESFDNLLRIVGPKIEKISIHYRDPVPARSRLYLTLRIGHSTVSMIILETCESLWDVLQNELFEPSERGWKEVAKEFEDYWNFPHCIGALDGKHVNIKAPSHSGSIFYNYKGSHSINLMAIASARYKFLMVDIGGEGRHSDGGIYKNSVMGYRLQHNQMYIPAPTSIINEGKAMPYILVVDEAFQLNNFTLRPYSGKTLTNEQFLIID